MNDLVSILRRIIARMNEIDRRNAGIEFRGRVKEVDVEKRTVRLEIGKDPEGNPVLSKAVPYQQTAGALKLHSPPSVGQSMRIISESGDIQQGVASPYHWSEGFEPNSDKEDQHRLTFGDVTVDINSDSVVASSGDVTVTIDGSGLHITGGIITHDDVVIDKTHEHTLVTRGAELSGPPPT